MGLRHNGLPGLPSRELLLEVYRPKAVEQLANAEIGYLDALLAIDGATSVRQTEELDRLDTNIRLAQFSLGHIDKTLRSHHQNMSWED